MSDAKIIFTELRFVVSAEVTDVYVYLDVEGDAPIGVAGWHHTSFPASTTTAEWLQGGEVANACMWPQEMPPTRVDHPLGTCCCKPCSDKRHEAFLAMERAEVRRERLDVRGTGTTTDPNDPRLKRGIDTGPTSQAEAYLVLSEDERAKGFIRPVRRSYKHVGERPKYPTRELTDEEKARYSKFGYVLFEECPARDGMLPGRLLTAAQLKKGCGTVTTMGSSIAETYARDPKFYGSTFCMGCHMHLPVEEFTWEPDGSVVGS